MALSSFGLRLRDALPPAVVAVLVGAVGCQAFGGTSGGDEPNTPVTGVGPSVCIGTCTPDPGWSITPDCAAATADIDRFWVGDFEGGLATNWYTYWDGTTFRASAVTADGVVAGGYQPATQTLPAGKDLCYPDNAVLHLVGGQIYPVNGVTYGGPFRGWGAGLGIALQKFNGRTPNLSGTPTRKCFNNSPDPACPPGYRTDLGPTAVIGRMLPPTCVPDPCPQSDEYAVDTGALDLSQYDGISFWARRGPNGQPGVRVLLGDKYTDDDLNFYAYTYNYNHRDQPPQPLHCQRVRECICRNQTPCVFGPKGEQATPLLSEFFDALGDSSSDPGSYCRPSRFQDVLYSTGTPAPDELQKLLEGLASGSITSFDDIRSISPAADLSGGGSVIYCDKTACDRPNPPFPNVLADLTMAPSNPSMDNMGGQDAQFFGRACTPYTWPNGISTSYCFDPEKDPPPAPSTEMCGDHWTKVVALSTEWQFYKIPFTDMRQQGWAKRAEHLDLTSASILRFTWDIGYIDFWVDEVAFYRVKR